MLHIVACIKQVPDTKVAKINPKTNTIDRASAPAILNPYDAHAVEEAVRLKKIWRRRFRLDDGPAAGSKSDSKVH